MLAGNLYIIATPIGNLDDISTRAIATLQEVDRIAAEDTRHSKSLLERYAINTPVCAYHEHNESKFTIKLIEQLLAGQNIALISDAGTPLINDPGYKLVAAAHDNNIRVIPIPGPSAIITALSVAGLATDRFIFAGYPPAKIEARKKYLQDYCFETRTLVFYEAPHRIVELIHTMLEIFGPDRRITIARELTKQFEQIVRDTIHGIALKLDAETIKIKGEFVIIVAGSAEQQTSDDEALRINQIIATELPPKKAAELTARITGKKKNEIYQLALKVKE